MKILKVKGTNLYDIFIGLGWENWSRYKINLKTKQVIFIDGKALPKNHIELVIERILKK